MKKILMVTGAMALIIVVMGAAGVAYAQGGLPPDGLTNEANNTMPRGGGGRGMHGNNTMPIEMVNMARTGGAGMMSNGSGLLADYMHTAMAEALGLTVDELLAREEAGDTAWDIASEQGLTFEEFQALMALARQTAIDRALADGVINAEQGGQMFHGQGGPGTGNGGPAEDCTGSGVPGDCPNGGGMYGRHGQNGIPQDNQP